MLNKPLTEGESRKPKHVDSNVALAVHLTCHNPRLAYAIGVSAPKNFKTRTKLPLHRAIVRAYLYQFGRPADLKNCGWKHTFDTMNFDAPGPHEYSSYSKSGPKGFMPLVGLAAGLLIEHGNEEDKNLAHLVLTIKYEDRPDVNTHCHLDLGRDYQDFRRAWHSKRPAVGGVKSQTLTKFLFDWSVHKLHSAISQVHFYGLDAELREQARDELSKSVNPNLHTKEIELRAYSSSLEIYFGVGNNWHRQDTEIMQREEHESLEEMLSKRERFESTFKSSTLPNALQSVISDMDLIITAVEMDEENTDLNRIPSADVTIMLNRALQTLVLLSGRVRKIRVRIFSDSLQKRGTKCYSEDGQIKPRAPCEFVPFFFRPPDPKYAARTTIQTTSGFAVQMTSMWDRVRDVFQRLALTLLDHDKVQLFSDVDQLKEQYQSQRRPTDRNVDRLRERLTILERSEHCDVLLKIPAMDDVTCFGHQRTWKFGAYRIDYRGEEMYLQKNDSIPFANDVIFFEDNKNFVQTETTAWRAPFDVKWISPKETQAEQIPGSNKRNDLFLGLPQPVQARILTRIENIGVGENDQVSLDQLTKICKYIKENILTDSSDENSSSSAVVVESVVHQAMFRRIGVLDAGNKIVDKENKLDTRKSFSADQVQVPPQPEAKEIILSGPPLASQLLESDEPSAKRQRTSVMSPMRMRKEDALRVIGRRELVL